MTGTVVVAALLAAAFGATYVLPVAVRLRHAFDPPGTDVAFDLAALRLIAEAARDGNLRLVVCERRECGAERHATCACVQLPDEVEPGLLLKIVAVEGFDDATAPAVTGSVCNGRRLLQLSTSNAAATIAAVALLLRDLTGRRPQIFLPWTDGHPLVQFARFAFFGVGEVPLRTREILRRAEPDTVHRPTVHVG